MIVSLSYPSSEQYFHFSEVRADDRAVCENFDTVVLNGGERVNRKNGDLIARVWARRDFMMKQGTSTV